MWATLIYWLDSFPLDDSGWLVKGDAVLILVRVLLVFLKSRFPPKVWSGGAALVIYGQASLEMSPRGQLVDRSSDFLKENHRVGDCDDGVIVGIDVE